MAATPLLTPEEISLIDKCQDMRPTDIALRIKASATVRPQVVATQVDCLQRLRGKVPSWIGTKGLYCPTLLAAQQCSSEAVARWRRTLVSTDELVDLTGGLGVDCFLMSQGVGKALYVESNEQLALAASNNFGLLGRDDIRVMHGTAEQTLKELEPAKRTIFLDPFRRSTTGHKVVRIADCTPDASVLAPEMLRLASEVFVKLSPMLDISEALSALPSVSDIYCVGAQGECKELLVRMASDHAGEPTITAIDINGTPTAFAFRQSEEKAAHAEIADRLEEGMTLYEPSPAMMKSAPYALISNRLDMCALHPQTHLYIASPGADLHSAPGRHFTIKEIYKADKKAIRLLTRHPDGASIVVRNFNATADELRKRLMLKESSSTFLFAVTSQCLGRIFIIAERA